MEKSEIIKACKEERLYDYVANNYWQMSKEELKTICLEAIYNLPNDEILIEELEERLND